MKKVQKNIPRMEAIEGLKMLVTAYQENHRITQEQKTIRANIKAQKEVKIEEIKQKAQLIKEYFNSAFEERKENFEKMFNGIEDALKSNNIEALAIYSNMIVETVKSSPLADTKKLLEDYRNPNIKEIEI